MFDDRFGLTQAVLDGRKTMTRRIVPEKLLECAREYMNSVHGTGADMHDYLLYYSPHKAFEVMSVAQSYKDLLEERGETGVSHLIAKAGYRNKMFVRADLMPHQIRITSVRIERIQDISDDDCLREGIIEYATCSECGSDLYSFAGATDAYYGPREAFAAIIDKISGKGTWDSNPWVFVYEFELVK